MMPQDDVLVPDVVGVVHKEFVVSMTFFFLFDFLNLVSIYIFPKLM